MINIFYWFFYYLKCAFNLLYSYCSNVKIKSKSSNIKKVNDYLYINKLSGTYFEMGEQYGKAMKSVLERDVTKSINFINENQSVLKRKIPYKYRSDNIFNSMMLLYEDNKKHYNPDIINFMKGISSSSDIKYESLLHVNLIGDLMDNHCILLGKKLNDKVLNLRTLDYGCPQMSHSLTVFNPINKSSYISLNLSIITGIFTGISKEGIFFGESYYDKKIGYPSLVGMPFHHISHKILSEAKKLDEAEEILKNCERTSNLQLLVSDKEKSRIYLACKNKFITQQDSDLVYSVTPNEKENFDKNFAYLDSLDNIIKEFVPRTKSGELHIMISYDKKLYVSVTTDILQSYNNTFYVFSLEELFKS